MFDWLSDNKEWLFSGIGVAALMALCASIERISRRRKQKSRGCGPGKRVVSGERLADAFTFGVVLARVIRIVETRGASAIPAQSWQTLHTLAKKLGVRQAVPAAGSQPVSLIHDFPSVSHVIERRLQQEDDPRVRNAFMFGNFISLSFLAPSTPQRNEMLARAEVFARDAGLSGAFLRNVFAQLRNIPAGPGEGAKITSVFTAVHDEIKGL